MGHKKYFMRKLSERRHTKGLSGIGPKEQRYAADITVGRAVDSLLFLVGKQTHSVADVIGNAVHDAHEPQPSERFVFSEEALLDVVKRVRRKQAGVAGWTVSSASGGFEDNPEEPVTELRLLWFQSPDEPDFLAFETNVLELAEQLALDFAQKEILVALHAAGREDIVRVSPKGMPAPGDGLDEYLLGRGSREGA